MKLMCPLTLVLPWCVDVESCYLVRTCCLVRTVARCLTLISSFNAHDACPGRNRTNENSERRVITNGVFQTSDGCGDLVWLSLASPLLWCMKGYVVVPCCRRVFLLDTGQCAAQRPDCGPLWLYSIPSDVNLPVPAAVPVSRPRARNGMTQHVRCLRGDSYQQAVQ